MPWPREVPSVLQNYFGGQEEDNSLVPVIFGHRGYLAAGVRPLFPFGHGMRDDAERGGCSAAESAPRIFGTRPLGRIAGIPRVWSVHCPGCPQPIPIMNRLGQPVGWSPQRTWWLAWLQARQALRSLIAGVRIWLRSWSRRTTRSSGWLAMG